MSKKQWLLIAAAIIAIIFLFSLPRIIIDNDSDNIEGLVDEHEEHSDSVEIPQHSKLNDTLKIESIKNIKKAFELSEDNKKKSIFADSLAKGYLTLREFDSAIYYGNLALKLTESDENRESLADIYYEAMSFSLDQNSATSLGTSARELYERLLKGQSERLDLMNKMAMTYVVSEAPMKGIMMLRQVLEKDPNNEDAIFNLGVLSIQSGQYDKGVQRFQKLIEIDSTNVKAYYFLGLCLKESDKPAEAKAILNKALSLGDNEEVEASINALLQEL